MNTLELDFPEVVNSTNPTKVDLKDGSFSTSLDEFVEKGGFFCVGSYRIGVSLMRTLKYSCLLPRMKKIKRNRRFVGVMLINVAVYLFFFIFQSSSPYHIFLRSFILGLQLCSYTRLSTCWSYKKNNAKQSNQDDYNSF